MRSSHIFCAVAREASGQIFKLHGNLPVVVHSHSRTGKFPWIRHSQPEPTGDEPRRLPSAPRWERFVIDLATLPNEIRVIQVTIIQNDELLPFIGCQITQTGQAFPYQVPQKCTILIERNVEMGWVISTIPYTYTFDDFTS
jgi:hypothetical protein